METLVHERTRSFHTAHELLESLAFLSLLIALGTIIYFDDIQLVETSREVPTIFNVRFMGVKVMDLMTVALTFLTVSCLLYRNRVEVTYFHKKVTWMFLTYWYAGIIGLAYGVVLGYDFLIWLQDYQFIIYLAGFFLLTFHLLNTKKKWDVFVVSFLVFLAAKNLLIFYRSISGVGRTVGDWAFRASYNSEFAYFPMMFFPVLLLFLYKRSVLLRVLLAVAMSTYLFNSLVGVIRTVWVMLGVGFLYLFFHLDRQTKIKLAFWIVSIIGIALALIVSFLPRFLTMAFSYKLASIFDWGVYADRSNATRTLEIVNITHFAFDHVSFLQGRGLGAWWDDSARRMLPDLGSGFTYKTKFYTSHILVLTQFLKLGLVATIIFWVSAVQMFRTVSQTVGRLPWDRWEKYILFGLNIGLLCAAASSASYVKLFLMIGINLGICASGVRLLSETEPGVATE